MEFGCRQRKRPSDRQKLTLLPVQKYGEDQQQHLLMLPTYVHRSGTGRPLTGRSPTHSQHRPKSLPKPRSQVTTKKARELSEKGRLRRNRKEQIGPGAIGWPIRPSPSASTTSLIPGRRSPSTYIRAMISVTRTLMVASTTCNSKRNSS